MARARKGKRLITVDGEQYLWTGEAPVTVVRLDGRGSLLRAVFDLHHAEPKQVADALTHALRSGWKPTVPGEPFQLLDAHEVLPEYPLLRAVDAGDALAVSALLEQGMDADTKFQGGSMLLRATSRNKLEVVRLLLQAGADPNGKGDLWPPLVSAAGNGWAAITEMLLAFGADVSVRDQHGRTALWRARNSGVLQSLRMGYPYLPLHTIEGFDEVIRLLEGKHAPE